VALDPQQADYVRFALIEFVEEACKEQRSICFKKMSEHFTKVTDAVSPMADAVLNAPSPELK
jgi:hypothetical protein